MHAGMLEVAGAIDVTQFWPTGRSDADTTNRNVNAGATVITVSKNITYHIKLTHVCDNSTVKGPTTMTPIKKGQPTIRLQGIDATELHYQPSPLSKSEKNSLSKAKL